MKLLLSLLFVLLLPGIAFALSGRVINVADGDTFTILAPGNRQVKIRLYGIDCPEKKQAYGQAARKFTAGLIAGKTVNVKDMGPDRYGRTVGIVVNLNEALLQAGLAWVYPQFCKASFCQKWKLMEAEARRASRGLWKDGNPVAPWKWRGK